MKTAREVAGLLKEFRMALEKRDAQLQSDDPDEFALKVQKALRKAEESVGLDPDRPVAVTRRIISQRDHLEGERAWLTRQHSD